MRPILHLQPRRTIQEIQREACVKHGVSIRLGMRRFVRFADVPVKAIGRTLPGTAYFKTFTRRHPASAGEGD